MALALRLRDGPWSGCPQRGCRWPAEGAAAGPEGLGVQAAAFPESGCPRHGCQRRATVRRGGKSRSSGDSSRVEAGRPPQATAALAAAVVAIAASRRPREPKGDKRQGANGFQSLLSQLRTSPCLRLCLAVTVFPASGSFVNSFFNPWTSHLL